MDRENIGLNKTKKRSKIEEAEKNSYIPLNYTKHKIKKLNQTGT